MIFLPRLLYTDTRRKKAKRYEGTLNARPSLAIRLLIDVSSDKESERIHYVVPFHCLSHMQFHISNSLSGLEGARELAQWVNPELGANFYSFDSSLSQDMKDDVHSHIGLRDSSISTVFTPVSSFKFSHFLFTLNESLSLPYSTVHSKAKRERQPKSIQTKGSAGPTKIIIICSC